MLKITQRDRIFAAIAIPAALLAAYIFLVRAPLARNVDSMRARLASLGDADTLRATSILGEHLRITSSELLAEGDDASPSAPLVREAIGGQPATLWRFTATATYPSVVAALRAISAQSLPMVPERATLEAPPASASPAARTWQLDICL